MKKDKTKRRKTQKEIKQRNSIRRLRYYLFVGMAFGFMYAGAAQVHAEEVKQPVIVSQADASQSTVQTSATSDLPAISGNTNVRASENNTAKDVNTADTNNTNNSSSIEINNSEINNSETNESTNTVNNSDSNATQKNTVQPKETVKTEATNTQQTVSQPEIKYKSHIQGKAGKHRNVPMDRYPVRLVKEEEWKPSVSISLDIITRSNIKFMYRISAGWIMCMVGKQQVQLDNLNESKQYVFG